MHLPFPVFLLVGEKRMNQNEISTPICNFVRKYADSDAVRMHMPGHKGVSLTGWESRDITEITGADELFAPEGIIAESEANASRIFGCRTLYSAEGSSLCIRAMLYLVMRYAAEQRIPPLIAAARNVHKTFLTAAVLLDYPLEWIPCCGGDYLSCSVTPEALDALPERPAAVYVTSPDYLGNRCDIRALSEYCRKNGILLLVDQAHGAYLRFLPESMHAADLGADLCCDSAHKTLPALTGTAYLHIGNDAPAILARDARLALELFASTSPSYLLMQSLDAVNPVLAGDFPRRLRKTAEHVGVVKQRLAAHGYALCGTEPMKITLCPQAFGYTGTMLAEMLEKQRIYAEFADEDHLVLMPSPMHTAEDLARTADALCEIPRRSPIVETPPRMQMPEAVLTPREAMMQPSETVPVEQAVGRICAEISVSCPPAVPVVMCGERIMPDAAECLRYYGKKEIRVAVTGS